MKEPSKSQPRVARRGLLAVAASVAALLPASVQAQFLQRNIVSDIPGLAEIHDSNLVNPWGVAYGPTGAFWSANAGTNTATLYNVNGATGAASVAPLVVHTPGPISGQVFNGGGGFAISGGPSRFLFGGLDGNLYAWNPAQGTGAVTAHPGTGKPYTGLGKGQSGGSAFLYAASPMTGKVDVFDSGFNKVTLAGSFTDPALPAGFAPFNVQNIGGQLYVAYADFRGPGGAVSVFNTDGAFVRRFATGGTLLNPWGMAQAPVDFGKFSNALLIGNFNDGDAALGPGYINAFDPVTGAFLGLLDDPSGNPIAVDGLWEILFGNGGQGGVRNQLYFSAGIEDEKHGLFGSLQAVPEPGFWAMLSGVGVAGMGLLTRRRR